MVGEIGEETSAEDTKRIARAMVDRGAELLIFVGGDGTARDITDAVGTSIPVVGVPTGVLLSDVSNQLPPGFIRVSVGTHEENDAFLVAFRRIIGEDV